MNKNIVTRVLKESDYIIKTNQTIREIASVFKVSKSTVHKDLHNRLKDIDYEQFILVEKILEYHKNIRHLRGGESTKKKYNKNI